MSQIRKLLAEDKNWTLEMAARAYAAFGFDYGDTGKYFDIVTQDNDFLLIRTDNAFICAICQPRACNFKIKECYVHLIACEGSPFEAIRLLKECMKWAKSKGVEKEITIASTTPFNLAGVAERLKGKPRTVYDIPLIMEN